MPTTSGSGTGLQLTAAVNATIVSGITTLEIQNVRVHRTNGEVRRHIEIKMLVDTDNIIIDMWLYDEAFHQRTIQGAEIEGKEPENA